MSFNFLMCSERSGSNFIVKLMNAHSNICGPSTKHIINPVARNLFRYSPIKSSKNWNTLVKDIYNLLNIDFSIWKKKFTLEELYSLAPAGDIKSLLSNIFIEEAKSNGKYHLFIKENHLYEFLPFLLLNFPEAKYIYQARDPRDVALSWKKNPTHYGGIVRSARQWKKDQQNFLKIHYELDRIGKSRLIRYEDLIENPESILFDLTQFLGLKYESSMLNFYEDEITKKNAEIQLAWNNLSRSIISDNKNKFKKELTDKEIMIIEKITWYEMRFLGYKNQYDLNELNKVSEKEINEFDEDEIKKLEFKRTEGVIKNMQAKKIFYER